MKAGNTLDTVVIENGRSVVRHYLQDVGSTFGTGANGPREYDEGWELLYDGALTRKRLVTSRLLHSSRGRRCTTSSIPPSGDSKATSSIRRAWRPRVATAAFLRARADDTFWAARRVAAFTDEMIRSAVRAGRYSDPAAEALLADVLIKRRQKIAARVSPGDQSARRLRALRRWPPQLPQRRRGRRRRDRRRRRLQRELGGVRQRHRRDAAARAGHDVALERHRRASAAAVGGRRVRARPGLGDRTRARRVDAAGRRILPANRRRLAPRRPRETSVTSQSESHHASQHNRRSSSWPSRRHSRSRFTSASRASTCRSSTTRPSTSRPVQHVGLESRRAPATSRWRAPRTTIRRR